MNPNERNQPRTSSIFIFSLLSFHTHTHTLSLSLALSRSEGVSESVRFLSSRDGRSIIPARRSYERRIASSNESGCFCSLLLTQNSIFCEGRRRGGIPWF